MKLPNMPLPKKPLLSEQPKRAEGSPIHKIRPLLAAVLVLASTGKASAQEEFEGADESAVEAMSDDQQFDGETEDDSEAEESSVGDGAESHPSAWRGELIKRVKKRGYSGGREDWPSDGVLGEISEEMKEDGWADGGKVRRRSKKKSRDEVFGFNIDDSIPKGTLRKGAKVRPEASVKPATPEEGDATIAPTPTPVHISAPAPASTPSFFRELDIPDELLDTDTEDVINWLQSLRMEIWANWRTEFHALLCGLIAALAVQITLWRERAAYNKLLRENGANIRDYNAMRKRAEACERDAERAEKMLLDHERSTKITMDLFYRNLERTRYALTREFHEESPEVKQARDDLGVDRDELKLETMKYKGPER